MNVMWACSPPRVSNTATLYCGRPCLPCSFVIRFHRAEIVCESVPLDVVANHKRLRRGQCSSMKRVAPSRRLISAPVMPCGATVLEGAGGDRLKELIAVEGSLRRCRGACLADHFV